MNITCAYCGTSIAVSPSVVAEMQVFSKRYQADDACVDCRRKVIDAYIVECEQKKEALQADLDSFAAQKLAELKNG